MSSEIARLRKQLEEESQAAWGALNGFASVGKHEIITYRYNNIGALVDQLKKEIGEEAAWKIAMDALDNASTQQTL